jgi:hypothetical protein
MTRASGILWLAIWCLALPLTATYGAVGCSLNDPDRDVRRIFPDATGYTTDYITIKERGGDSLAAEIESRLGGKLDQAYETIDVPYAYYTVLKGKELIGRVHGVNQKGKYGGMQLILATDPDGAIVDFYYQRLSSPEAKRFTVSSFTDQFKGLTLSDFYRHRGLSGKEPAAGPIGKIEDPTQESAEDFAATLRGVMKNLILLDEFQLDNKYLRLIRKEQAREKSKERTDEKTDE